VEAEPYAQSLAAAFHTWTRWWCACEPNRLAGHHTIDWMVVQANSTTHGQGSIPTLTPQPAHLDADSLRAIERQQQEEGRWGWSHQSHCTMVYGASRFRAGLHGHGTTAFPGSKIKSQRPPRSHLSDQQHHQDRLEGP
jgi:hypothetical protein